MFKTFLTVFISVIITLLILLGIYYFMPIGFIESPISINQPVGSTITEILGTNTLSASRTIINTNFTNLNAGKIEVSTTTLPLITTLLNLTSVGTIGTGIWQGTAIGVGYGGTGTTSPSQYLVILGNGSAGLTVASSTGTSGQFLTSNGSGAYPSWQSASVDQSTNYNWTGYHNFNSAAYFNSSTTISASDITTHTLKLNGINYAFPPTQQASSTVLATNGSGSLFWQEQNWRKLGQTILGSAASSVSLSSFASSTSLMIEFYSLGTALSTRITFNNDGGNNYGYNVYENYAAGARSSDVAYISIAGTSTSSPVYYNITATNRQDSTKIVNWIGGTTPSDADYGSVFSGTGVWNNTANQITTITMTSGAGNYPAGTRLTVYGSN